MRTLCAMQCFEGAPASFAHVQCAGCTLDKMSSLTGMSLRVRATPVVLPVQGVVPRTCSVLTKGHPEAAKLTVEVLIKLCLFSSHSYMLALKVRAAMLMAGNQDK